MEKTEYQYEITKLKTALWITLLGSLFAFLPLIQSINNNASLWRVACAFAGFAGVAAMSVVVFQRLVNVKKDYRDRSNLQL